LLDIELFRNIESEKKRFKNPDNAKNVVKYDKKYLEVLKKWEDLRRKRNEISHRVGILSKSGKEEDAERLKLEIKTIKEQIEKLENLKEKYYKKREDFQYLVGNIIHDSVPIGETEENNEIIRIVGELPDFDFKPLSHVDLVDLIDGVDIKKASEVVGSRFYYLKGDIVSLNIALINFALDKLKAKGYEPVWTPYFIKYDIIKAAAELSDFEEQLYKIQDEDLFLIATSEQPLAAYHYDEIINPERLPLKYVGISSCFRREAGSHGKDTLGIFRVHQFEKVEQFIFCEEKDSWKIYEELIENAEEIFQELKIPYRIVNIASGELNDNAAKKLDLEAWFPAANTYRELVSCSNCTDYQARKLKIRIGKVGSQKEKEIMHTLNSTAIATERTICCLLENYQRSDHSVLIPEALQKYMNGQKIIKAIK
jgi:seryl-tRNA synthetase